MAEVPGESPDQLYGQGRAIGFVADALNRVGERETPPLVLILGPGGTGKTAFLNQIEAEHKKYRPMARLALTQFTTDGPADVMAAMGRQLCRGAKRVSKFDLPLLDTGIDAIVGGNMGQPAAKHLGWYRSLFAEDNDLHTSSLAELRNEWHLALEGRDRRARLTTLSDLWRILCFALLADLRKEFDTRAFGLAPRPTNCVLLMDNADTQNGIDFLNTLAACRQSDAGVSDPLLVIATQRTRPTLRPPVGEPYSSGEPANSADEPPRPLSYSAWKKEALPRSPWTPVRLAWLRAEESAKVIRSHASGTSWYDQRIVHELTAGHPAAVRTLALELKDTQAGPSRNLITDAVADTLLEIIRPAAMTDGELLSMSVYCQPAIPGPGAAARVFRTLEWDGIDELSIENRFLDLMWASKGEGIFRIDPLPKMLLTRTLARNADLWNRVNQGFLAHFKPEEASDPVPVWFHRLALVTALPAPDIDKLARYLDDMLRRPSQEDAEGINYVIANEGAYLSVGEWDTMLTDITSAPTRLRRAMDGSGGSPQLHPDARDVVSQVAGVDEPTSRRRIIARLSTALWLHNDRAFDPWHTLADLISHEYQQLARAVPGNCEAFWTKASQFRDIANNWKDSW